MNTDIVAQAIEFYDSGDYDKAFELAAQFDKYQRDSFFKYTGIDLDPERTLDARIVIGAYKIESEPDEAKKTEYLNVYDSLVEKKLRYNRNTQ
jgi:hypothetical protein